MTWKRKLLTGDALYKRVRELNVSEETDSFAHSDVYGRQVMPVTEYELQRRVMEAEQHSREHRLWIVAVVSMIISVLSAAAAWWAVLHQAGGK